MRTPEEYEKLFKKLIDDEVQATNEFIEKYQDNPWSLKAQEEDKKMSRIYRQKYNKLREEFLRDYPNGRPEEYKKNI